MEKYKTYQWIENEDLKSTELGYFVSVLDTIAKFYAGHSFKACMKVETMDIDGKEVPAYISIGWGDTSITGEEYYAEYDILKDTIKVHSTEGNEPGSWEFDNPRKEYLDIITLYAEAEYIEHTEKYLLESSRLQNEQWLRENHYWK